MAISDCTAASLPLAKPTKGLMYTTHAKAALSPHMVCKTVFSAHVCTQILLFLGKARTVTGMQGSPAPATVPVKPYRGKVTMKSLHKMRGSSRCNQSIPRITSWCNRPATKQVNLQGYRSPNVLMARDGISVLCKKTRP